MPTVLALSPHLDDAVFSCGGLLALLADQGWRVVMTTAFTRSVPGPTGFALACQTDKGLAPEVDYMALRRAEDTEAAAILGVADVRWLDLLEAPHRGYNSAPELFGPVLDGDDAWRPLAGLLRGMLAEVEPALVLAPQGLGNHVDHRQMIRAVLAAGTGQRLAFYRDTPYALRNPGAVPDARLAGCGSCTVGITAGLDRKVAASCAYISQVGFQFGGPAEVGRALRAFAAAEGGGAPAERFLAASPEVVALLGALLGGVVEGVAPLGQPGHHAATL
jgi:LmbE family N-acetylglucosaminyl deacetylase